MMRFISLMLLLAIGLGAAWGVCRFTTPRYESRCECEVVFGNLAEGGFEENINTRLAAWRTEPGGAWPDVEIARVPRSRLISVTACGARAEDVAARANAATEALVAYTTNANSSRAEAALASVRAEIVRLRQTGERLDQELRHVKEASASDMQDFNRQLLEQELAQATADVHEQEKRVRAAAERAEFLERAQEDPSNPGDIPASVSASSEVRRAYGEWISAYRQLQNLRKVYTEEYQEVKNAVERVNAARQHVVDVVQGARTVAEKVLSSAQNRLKESRRKEGNLRAEREGMTLRAGQAEEKIARLEKENTHTSAALDEARQKEKEIRRAAEQDAVSIRVARPASVPAKPVYPDPTIAYSIGAAAPVLLWFLFGLLWPSVPYRHDYHHHHHHHHSHSSR